MRCRRRRDGTVHDYVGGLADLASAACASSATPATRIAEDYLRILRFFRFHALYGRARPIRKGLPPASPDARVSAHLSRERVRMELMKLLVAPHAVPALAVMSEAGLLIAVLGGVPDLASFSNMAKVEAALGLAPDPVAGLVRLACRIAEDAERLWQRLRLANAEHERMASMAEGWWRVAPARREGRARAALPARAGAVRRPRDAGLDALAGSVDGFRWHALATLPQRWKAPAFPLKAADFIKRGLRRARRSARRCARRKQAWIAADFPADGRLSRR